MRAITPACITLLLIGSIGGCGPGADSADEEAAWTIERGALRFAEDLYVSETEDFVIGSANDIAVGPEGRIYVADGEQHHVKVLSPDGELIATIGSRGRGPGQFKRPAQVDLARGDSLYVFDGYWSRLSVFAPDHEFAYSFSMRTDRRSARNPMILEEGGYVIVQSLSARQAVQGKKFWVRTMSAGGVIGDTLFAAPPPPIVMEKLSEGRWRYYYVPFISTNHFLLGSEGYVHFAHGDSLNVSVYDVNGVLQETISIPFDAVPVTEVALERVTEGWDAHQRSMVVPEIPETKPAFTSFTMDERGRYWFKRPTADPKVAEWWIVDADEHRILTTTAPSHITFSVIRDGYAYGTIGGRNELPAVVRYRIVGDG